MHVAIDLGLNHSSLVCWQENRPIDQPSISVKVPGLAVFKSETSTNTWDRQHLQAYLTHLYREYLLPSRMVISTAALAVPHIMSLKLRRQLLDIMEEVMGINEAAIIPRYLALAAGYHLNSQLPTCDIMVVDIKGSIADFAFISVCPEVITLEQQSSGGLQDLRESAEENGYLSPSGSNLDYIIVLGDGNPQNEISAWLSAISKQIKTHYEDEPEAKVAEGLTARIHNKSLASKIRLSMIYPFDFYINDFYPDLGRSSITKIPFDTVNLEIDSNSRFKIFSFNKTVCGAPMDRTKLQVYELHSHILPDLSESNIPWDLILDIDSVSEDFPTQVDLILDMQAAILEPELPNQIDTTDLFRETDFWKRWELDLRRLKDKMSNASYEQALEADDPVPPASSHAHLKRQFESSLIRIQSLLTLWEKR